MVWSTSRKCVGNFTTNEIAYTDTNDRLRNVEENFEYWKLSFEHHNNDFVTIN